MTDGKKPGYSRLAILSGITAVLVAANYLCLFMTNHQSVYLWARRNFIDPNLAMFLFFASGAGMAPISLVLSSLALRTLRRNPGLHGTWIARIAAVVGTLGTAGFVFFIVVAIWNP